MFLVSLFLKYKLAWVRIVLVNVMIERQ